MAYTEQELRQMVKDAGIRMLEENLVQGTWGNISVRIDDKHALVTPSGLDYVVMTPDDLPVVDIETLEWTGPRKPTSERKIHAAILRARPEINVVLHSHPTWGATFASTHLSLPAMNDNMKKYLGGDVKCAKYGLAGTGKLTKNALAAIEGRNACFLANHGVFVCGKTREDAFEACRALENGCREYIERETVKKTGADEYSVDLSVEYFNKTYKK